MTYGDLNNLVNDDVVGERIFLRGRVLDGNGAGVNDAVVEIWQADADGVYSQSSDDAAFFGFGRAATDDDGRYAFKTIKPGAVDDMAPHLNVRIFMRGLLLHVVTRIYFSDVDNSADSTYCATYDQRSVRREIPCDAGAYELIESKIYLPIILSDN